MRELEATVLMDGNASKWTLNVGCWHRRDGSSTMSCSFERVSLRLHISVEGWTVAVSSSRLKDLRQVAQEAWSVEARQDLPRFFDLGRDRPHFHTLFYLESLHCGRSETEGVAVARDQPRS